MMVFIAAGLCGMTWRGAESGFPWSFPRDHWPHPEYASEWWYFTGHLEDVDDPRRRFGYQFTVFRVGLVPPADPPAGHQSDPGRAGIANTGAGMESSRWASRQLFMGHAAIGDLQKGEHHFSDLLYREMPLLAGFADPGEPLIAWSRGPAGTDAQWTLRWNGQGFDMSMSDQARGMALDLTTRPTRPLVFQGPGGLSRKGQDGKAASLYYSFTRLATEGQLTLGESTWKVSGTSWMDKEFSSTQLSSGQVGWDWMALQLNDGRDLMLYLLRRADGSIDFRNATLVQADGPATYLNPEQWSLRVLDRWTSAATGADYPARWRLEIVDEGLSVEIVPAFADQENVAERSAGLFYWEGAVQVLDTTGQAVGRGYVELTGYGEGNRPPL